MPELLGSGDAVLREVERAYPDVDFHVRGNRIMLSGEEAQVAAAATAVDELRSVLAAGVPLTADIARESVRMLRSVQGVASAAAAAAGAGRRESRPTEVLARSILSTRGRTIRPRTAGQASYVTAIENHTITFGIGPAGTGKTYLAMAQAVAALQAKKVNRIVLTRPAVEAGERLGFLPGSLNDKIDPYLRPLYDALHDMVDPESIPRLMEAGTIEVAPLAYMRGRTLNDAFVILDEAQNTTREQMKMFLTRLGFGSTMVVTGDITQVDLPGGTTSGLRAASEILEGVEDIAFCRLGAEDVVRHRLVSDIITAYEASEQRAGDRPLGQQRRFERRDSHDRHGREHRDRPARTQEDDE
ncbi:PhoH family protein [Demequina capsici]|uniref:PhoH-like protein n=2 Tax=Demequina capsici TaxID=3075620 RepID=A0AA96FG53_9MICO|nr:MULTISPECIES: PhoH family protein [unclassified Demequina]WNM25955.1 PhoH family protein [Demequina sp. OYTSA14]WNM28834.1 PhoH family protein [Demequina sp. PMTSA13]